MSAPTYDHNDVWEKEIKPLTDKLVEVCGKHGMPLLVCSVVRCDGERAEFFMGFMPGENGWAPEEMKMAAMILRLSDGRVLADVVRMMKKHVASLPKDVTRN
jgi:hypothetical protein